MLKDREWIVRHIPHQGTMCLLDEVLEWDAAGVRCLSRAHRSIGNPLRARERLAAVCGIEFAAQAMAVHGALLAGVSAAGRRVGYLASVRGVELHVARLDDIEEDLIAAAQLLGGNESTVLYQFSLSAGDRRLLAGRATIVTNPAVVLAGFTTVSR